MDFLSYLECFIIRTKNDEFIKTKLNWPLISSRSRSKIILLRVYTKEEVNFMETLKVSAKSNPNSVAGALAGAIRENGKAEIQAIGAGALNQAIKAVAIARGFVAPGGVDLICIPAFVDIEIDGEERTAIKLLVGHR